MEELAAPGTGSSARARKAPSGDFLARHPPTPPGGTCMGMAADSPKMTEARSDCGNPAEKNPANGHPTDTLEQEKLVTGGTGEGKPEGNKWKPLALLRGCRRRFAKGNKWKLRTIVLSVVLGISVIANICLLATCRQGPAAPRPPDTTSPSPDASPCPQRWVVNEGRCYFFSDTEQTWNASWMDCSSQGGSLLAMDTPQERGFVLGPQHLTYFWLDFRRGEVREPWKHSNGSLFNNRFPILGEGLCAYMNERNASSTYCDNNRHWICVKPVRGH